MKKKNITETDMGKVIMWLFGGILSFVPVFGETPMLLSFFSAAFMAGKGRAVISLFLLGICCIRGISPETVRYFSVAVSFGFIWKIMEARGVGKKKWIGSIYIGALFAFVGLSGGMLSVNGKFLRWFILLEGIFISSVSVLLNLVGDRKYVSRQKVSVQTEFRQYPERERMLEASRALKKLGGSFFDISDFKEGLDREDKEKLFRCLAESVCVSCSRYKKCWMMHSYGTLQATEQMFDNDESAATVSFLENCLKPEDYRNTARDLYDKAKIAVLWENRLQESREAVGMQLMELSGFISNMTEEIYGKVPLKDSDMENLKKGLKSIKLELVEGKGFRDKNGNPELFLYLRTSRGNSISIRETEKKVSAVFGEKMSAVRDGRRVINGESVWLHFKKESSYKYLYGVVKQVKENEVISGDNFTITVCGNEKILIGLSDGMGSGIKAGRDSEMVMDFMEQFFEAGFSRQTAVNLLNSTWIARGLEPGGATLDLCTVDLQTGEFEILKQGAAASFILEKKKVRTISGKSLPLGVCTKDSFEIFNGELGKETYIVMVSDGVTDAFRQEDGETAIERLLAEEGKKNPRLLAETILEEAMEAGNRKARDDMTVLVLGLWKKEG